MEIFFCFFFVCLVWFGVMIRGNWNWNWIVKVDRYTILYCMYVWILLC